MADPEQTTYVNPGITPSDHSMVVLIPAYVRPLTIFEKIRTMFICTFFSIPVDSHSGSGWIFPQHNCSRSFTTSAQVSLMVTNPMGTTTLHAVEVNQK